jgi:type I restriction enzyme M protein
LQVLVHEYGYTIDQIGEELEVTGRGSGHARADFVVWRTTQDKVDGKNPLIIVECKADNVTIKPADYGQGDNYARLTNAAFLVTHNNKETRYWRVIHERMPKTLEEIENIPHADASDKQVQELLSRLKVFKEDEFANLLHQCHNVIRNREKKDPAAAFDEIAKVLFIKVCIERRLRAGRQRQNLFTADFLDQQAQIHDDPIGVLFEQTKKEYKADQIFEPDETDPRLTSTRLRLFCGRALYKQCEWTGIPKALSCTDTSGGELPGLLTQVVLPSRSLLLDL